MILTEKEYKLLKDVTKLENDIAAIEGFGRSTAGEVLGRELVIDACGGESELEAWLRGKIIEHRRELDDHKVMERRFYDFRITA